MGRKAGRRTFAAVTCMDQPLGDNIGCNAEVREAIEVLQGKKNDLTSLSLFHCTKILAAARGIGEEEAAALAEGAIASGAALEKLAQLVYAQGGDARAIHDFSLLPLAPHLHTVRAARGGHLRISALALGRACCAMGGGRVRADAPVGILLKKRAGERVKKGDILAEVYYRAEEPDAIALVESAFSYAERYEPRPLVYTFIGED